MEGTKGLIIVHTGPGKGKTTAAFGLCLRAAGRDHKSAVVQFLKGGDPSGEIYAVQKYFPDMVQIHTYGREGFIGGDPREEDYDMAEEALNKAGEMLESSEISLVVLDEINVAISLGLIGTREVIEFLQEKPREKHVVLTGREAPQRVLELADTITIFGAERHHFNAGVSAVEGIEY